MKFVIVAGAVLLGFMLLSGCSDDGSLTLEDYFAELDAANTESLERSNEVDVPDVAADATLDQRKESARAALGQLAEIADDWVAELDDLDAPDEVERLHGLYIAAARKARAALNEYSESIEDAASIEALAEAGDDTAALDNAGVAVEDICIDLQDAAGEYEIEVDLDCGE